VLAIVAPIVVAAAVFVRWCPRRCRRCCCCGAGSPGAPSSPSYSIRRRRRACFCVLGIRIPIVAVMLRGERQWASTMQAFRWWCACARNCNMLSAADVAPLSRFVAELKQFFTDLFENDRRILHHLRGIRCRPQTTVLAGAAAIDHNEDK